MCGSLSLGWIRGDLSKKKLFFFGGVGERKDEILYFADENFKS
jgi:hypothetical protein